jgi:hypothetical protein
MTMELYHKPSLRTLEHLLNRHLLLSLQVCKLRICRSSRVNRTCRASRAWATSQSRKQTFVRHPKLYCFLCVIFM